MSGRIVRALAGISAAGALHALVNLALLRRPPADPPPVRRPVTVVLPVRDEEAHVADCLAALLDQRGIEDLRVVVVDDGSTDGTADVVRAVHDHRVRLLTAEPPPPGWLGKPHACATGAGAPRSDDEVLVFVDADVRLFPDAIAAAVAVLDEHGLDLVSPWPRPLAEGLAERLVQPLRPLAVGDDAAGAPGRTLPPALARRGQRPVPGAHPARLRPGRRARGRPRRGARGHRPAAGGEAVRGPGRPDRRVPPGRLPHVRRLAGGARRLGQVAVGRGGRLPGEERRRGGRADRRVRGPAGRGAARARGRGCSATPPGCSGGRRSPRGPAGAPGRTRWPIRSPCSSSTCSWPGRCCGHRRGTLAWRGRPGAPASPLAQPGEPGWAR